MSKTITVRLDQEASRALARLESAGLSRSEAVREALVRATVGDRSREAMRREAERLASDPDDLREVAEVQRFMEGLSEPW